MSTDNILNSCDDFKGFYTFYSTATFGKDVKIGYFAVVRENTIIGDHVVIGSGVIIENDVEIGDWVKIMSNTYVASHTKIGSHVFIGPGAVFLNDKYPQRLRDVYEPQGPIIEDNVTIGANATILPDIQVGSGSIVGAGAVVTKDVPNWSLAVGVPARFEPLPDNLKEVNRPKQW